MTQSKYDVYFPTTDWNGHPLPDWLLYLPKAKDSFVSPAAQFKPVAALNGAPWQSSTTPDQQKKAKSLIIDSTIYLNGLGEYDVLAQIEWFKIQGIKIYLCIEKDGTKQLISCNEEEHNFEAAIDYLSRFDESTDYDQLAAEKNLVRDKTAVLNAERSKQLFACLHQQKRYLVSNESNSSKPQYRFYDASPYAIHIPYAITDQNKVTKARAYPIVLKQLPRSTDVNELIQLIKAYPYRTLEILEENKRLITHDIVSVLFNWLPDLRAVTIPFCYDLIGQSPSSDIDYYLILRNKLSVYQLPIKKLEITTRYELAQLKSAYPNLEERFEILLQCVSTTVLSKVFPHRAHEIFTYSPPTSLEDLSNYINAVPEDADSIIQRYQSLIDNEIINKSFRSKSFLQRHMSYFWSIFKNANSTKVLLNQLAESQILNFEDLINYVGCNPPNIESFLEKKIPIKTISSILHFLRLVNANSALAPYLLKNNQFKFSLDLLSQLTNKNLERRLYETYQPSILSPYDLMHLISLYPENFDRIIEEYQSILENNEVFYIDDLTPEIALKLIERYPNKAQLKIINPIALISRPKWHHPRLIAHFLKLQHLFTKESNAISSWVSFYSNLPIQSSILVDQIMEDQKDAATSIKYLQDKSLLYTPEFAHPKHSPSFEECTSLNLGVFDDYLKIDFKKLPNLIFLKINLCTADSLKIQRLFDDLKRYCPKLNYLSLPESLTEQTRHLPYKIKYQKAINLKEIPQGTLQEPSSNFTHSAHIFVANNNLSNATSGSDKSNSFNMVNTGELLNHQGEMPHRMRTGIIELNADLNRKRYQKPILTTIPLPQTITPQLINECKRQRKDFYYHLKLQIQANQPARLPSADAQEQLIALDAQGAKAELKRGTDDFYYVTTDKDCELSYLIKAPEPQYTLNYESLKADDPIKVILDSYLHSPNYTPNSKERLSKRDRESYPEWFERLYQASQGSCQERCFAVWYQIDNNLALRARVRMVRIDNNHVRLEIKTLEGDWIQVDLGGMEANLNYDNRHSYKAQPAFSASEQQETLALEKKSKSKVQSSSSSSIPFEPAQSGLGILAEKPRISDTFQRVHDLINRHKTPKIINYIAEVFDYNTSPVLLISQNREACAQEFLHQAKMCGRPVFFLHDPNQIKVGKDQIHLQSGAPTILSFDALDLFKKQNRGNPNAMILVDWAAFTPQQRVALNSVIDRHQSLYGKKIPFKTYSICPELPEDNSFVSRHKHLVKPLLPLPALSIAQPSREANIDLKGLPDWQEALFGPILLNNNILEWSKSEFVQALEDKGPLSLTINLSNIPTQAKQHIKILLQRAKAQGYIEYHHARIPIPEHIKFQADSSEFNFNSFEPVNLIKEVNSTQLPPEYHLINTELFDFLLTNKEVSKGQYQIVLGWLKQAKGKPLNLFITSGLSDNQWYCLLERAKHYQVQLTLYCAKGVKVPNPIKVNKTAQPEYMSLETPKEPLIYLSNSPKQCIPADDNTLCFAIEDYSYQDLMTWIEHQYHEGHFTDFNEQPSDVLLALQQRKTVVLYGEFSTQMMHALQPLMLSQALARKQPWPGRLVLSIDTKSNPDLNFLPEDVVKSAEFLISNKKNPKAIYKELPDNSLDLIDSEQKADLFINHRLAILMDALHHHAISSMVGKTGVGKTFLIRELKERYADLYQIYHELEHFEEFALDDSDKIKVLFLDEVNIANKHLTMLDPLIKGGNPRILYKGKIYPLTDKHRIVCASNPLNYGGGRVMQKLFNENDIPEIHLEEIPAYYIYERMLKPIYQQIAPYINETAFKDECLRYLIQYKQSQLNEEKGVCVRNLQEWVVSFALQKMKHQPESMFKKKKITIDPEVTDIVITQSMTSINKNLRSSIEVRKQRYLDQRSSVLGLNGCLIEGRPGMGKTELVRYRLAKAGYVQAKSGKDAPENTLTYIKIDASLPDELKKKYIRKAFNQGQIVWLDEVNSVLDEGLEQWLNAFLSGFDPDTHQKAQRPGFMLLVTANGIGMEGRSLIGPAFRGRLTQLSMPEPSITDLEMITENKLPGVLTKEQRHNLAQDIDQLMQKNKNLCLRDITPKLKSISQIYIVRPNKEIGPRLI